MTQTSPLRSEVFELQTDDGRSLAATLGGGESFRGTVVMAHAMFARQSAFRWLSTFLAARGWRTLSFDFRGHGRSECPRWSYDDLVLHDLPAVVGAVRERSEGKPVVLVGHSLGGQVALAALGCGLVTLDAVVLVAANVWLRDFEPSARMWAFKRLVIEAFVRASRRAGRFPARGLGLGSDDEALDFVEDMARFTLEGRWESRDRTRDYRRALGEIRTPIYAIASTGDRVSARPVCVARMLARCRGPLHIDVVRTSDDGSRPPGHGSLLTSGRARSAFERAEAFLRTRDVA